MIELADDFSTLPAEYKKVIHLAQDTHKIKVTPLQELKGGQTGANLYLVSVSPLNSNQVQHLVLKLDHKSKTTKMDELERHRTAVKEAAPEFANNHIAGIAYDRIELESSVAIFYNIAGQSLQNYRPLASYQQQNKLEKLFSTTIEILLSRWNVNPTFEKAVHPQKVLTSWLGYRLNPGGNIEHFLENICQIHPDTAGLLIQGNVFPNPYVYSRKIELWGKIRPIDTIMGFHHGDLNIGNILAKFNGNAVELTGCYLIDFALFKEHMPLFYDHCYLETSYLIRELTRSTFQKWIDMITRFAEKDILDPLQVPIELTGACSVINAGRKDFGNWVEKFYMSLSDDLWGQFWLAAVAAGLNYCNKTIISERERLAGLIFAAAHLKRYHQAFGVQLPSEVKHIDISSQTEDILKTGITNREQTSGPRNNLPAQTTLFIGRQKEVSVISELLQREDVRLLTLTGPGGTGKTRLAIQAAAHLIAHFPDGMYFVDFAPIREAESFFATIARTVGLRETSDRSLLDELGRQLRAKKMLFLLDNFEQLTSAAPQVGELLHNCPQLKFLVTSREALHMRGEQICPVSPLTLPGTDFKKQSIEQLTRYEAVQLFIERALAVRPDFKITSENAPIIAEICSRLDGLPLAIELAAARITLFSPGDLLKRVSSRLKLLRGGARDLPVRQQALRDTIDWSYELLNTGEQRLFALFSVFHGCTFEQVEEVTKGIKQLDETDIDILDGLTSLVDKSLIRRSDQNDGIPRLLMLETIREYASERLDNDPEFNTNAKRVHATYFADFSQLQWKRLIGDEREAALSEYETDLENVRTAWRYWVAEENLEQLQKLTDCLWMLYDARGWYFDTVELTNDLLNVLSSNPSTPERAQQQIMLQTSLARVLMAIKGCTPEVEEAYTRALDLCEKHGEIPQSFPVLRALSSFYVYVANFKKSAQYGKQILNLAEQLNDVNMRVDGHLVYGYSLVFSGNLKEGMEHLEKGIANYNPKVRRSQSFRFGNNPGVTSYTTSALCLWMLGFPDRALKLTDDAILLANKLNHPFSVAYALFHTGLLHLWRGDGEMVLQRSEEALEIARKHEFQIWNAVATCLHGAALAGTGQANNGLMEFKQGIEMYSELKTPPVFWPLLLSLQAGTYILAGKPKEGLTLMEESLEIIGRDSGSPILADLYRFKGDVLLMVSPEKLIEAESLLQQSLEIARRQQTVMFELKASMSLCRLWQQEGKKEQGRLILNQAYEKFTEGFTTVDLTEAKNLLSELS